MGRMLVVEYDCDGNGCGEVTSEPYQPSFSEEIADLEKGGWLAFHENNNTYYYCPKCKLQYGG